ncbi:helix-turn-helix domain-containing protein [Companilactobacillus insicii]|uniref:helix-turn-helix domain-containing protein n=1 Tax=Companilactobacillus insicii TaxID=1732567 RepID=UPI000F76B1EB|nr:helix-turn-helix transcriptional regulator [Companilactobacillus insicii]
MFDNIMEIQLEKISFQIKRILIEKDISLPILADKTGLTSADLRMYITCRSMPTISTVKAIARYIERPIGWIYFGEVSEYIYNYLVLRGNEAMLNDYPDVPRQIEYDFYNGEFKNPGWENEFGYPEEVFIDDCFFDIERECMNDHVRISALRYLANHNIPFRTLKDKESGINSVVNLVSEVREYTGDIRYEDQDDIDFIIEDYFKRM